jgi:hypothetical protein
MGYIPSDPPIIDAAVRLYSERGFQVGTLAARGPRQSHVISYGHRTPARDRNERQSVSSPGSGFRKTLVGLSAVHHPDIRDGFVLSGSWTTGEVLRGR